MAKRKQWRRGRLALYSIHVVIPYRRSVATEDSRRWPHPLFRGTDTNVWHATAEDGNVRLLSKSNELFRVQDR